MTHPFMNTELLESQAEQVSGGIQLSQLREADPKPAIRPQNPPREYTQAIGEGGGYLPDLF